MANQSPRRVKAQSVIDQTRERGRHFTQVFIQNFRGFKNFTIASLERINLIGGQNNVGKTTLLEALFLLLGAANSNSVISMNVFRGMDTVSGDPNAIREWLFNHLFYKFDYQSTITIGGDLGGAAGQVRVTLKPSDQEMTTLPLQNVRLENVQADSLSRAVSVLELTYFDETGFGHPVEIRIDNQGIHLPKTPVEPLFPAIYLPAHRRLTSPENAMRYGHLEITGQQEAILPALQILEPRLKRITTIVTGNYSLLYGDLGLGRMLPLATMGAGLASLTSLLLAIYTTAGGVVLIDEIENGLHYSKLTKIWQAIATAARQSDTQVFATTHSWECIKAAHEAFQSSATYDFCYHRLQQVNETVEAVAFDQESLQTTIESGWEIR